MGCETMAESRAVADSRLSLMIRKRKDDNLLLILILDCHELLTQIKDAWARASREYSF